MSKQKAPAKPAAAGDAKPKSMNKSTMLNDLATATGLSRKQVAGFFDEFGKLIKKEMGKKGPGVLNVLGLFKIKRIHKDATKATTRENPFKPGEMMTVKAKPARTTVKILPLKDLKGMV